MHMQIKVAFVGNPNCGKTTLFNAYTGAKHKVGNWAGVTVEKKEGIIKHDGNTITLVDLPGIYSLSPYSMEEILTREYIMNYDPDVVVNIVDASNLERNLFLTLQLIELGKPVVVVLNMMDIMDNKGYNVNIERLSSELGVSVIPVSATKQSGLTKLLHQLIKTAKMKSEYIPIRINYGTEIEQHIDTLSDKISETHKLDENAIRWLAIKLLEKDSEVMKRLKLPNWKSENYSEEIGKIKYDYISCFIKEVLQFDHEEETFSDKVDKVITNNFLGIPIFLLMMIMVFAFTFSVGNYFAGLFESILFGLSWFIKDFLIAIHVTEWVVALIVDGIIGGVGGILVFLPNIACLFIAISILEDSGYMARVALLMDKFMCKIGLNGKAFIPMILGFGCSVPAIMTARTLENEHDRLITTMITPFMSCSAKMPIYVLFSRIFFPGYEIIVSFSLYLMGVFIAILVALVFKATLKKGKTALIMELPQYKKPSFKTIAIFVWEKVKHYIIRAGTVIFLASVVLWFILEFNPSGHVDMTESFGAYIGKAIAPIFAPLGFGTWEAALSLIAGIMGKEIVVSSMAVIFGVTESGFTSAFIAAGFNAVSAYAFMAFCLLYTPCVATIGIIKKETNSWKWTFFSFAYQLTIAWFVAFLIYQIGSRIFLS
ncbi:MAG: ferrous iron transport protein B [Firmicutes bacterium HGW-Firmicutes-1]|nr:MAG: ferrous iron transport protein B [Firmicutes bacterium HGW-Firmicutes-1]